MRGETDLLRRELGCQNLNPLSVLNFCRRMHPINFDQAFDLWRNAAFTLWEVFWL
jgi:hypothetical protein